jgi:hypothetical protein
VSSSLYVAKNKGIKNESFPPENISKQYEKKCLLKCTFLFFQTFYSNSAESNSLHPLSKRSASGTSGNPSNGSEYILPPEIRAEIVAAAKRGKLQQYLQLRKHRFVKFKQ